MPGTTHEAKIMSKSSNAIFVTANVSMREIVEPLLVERKVIDRDAILELAGNIKQVGLINALTVKKNKGKYEIVAGHRRYLALKMLGIKKVAVKIINEVKASGEIVKLSENLMREDLNDWEEGNMLYILRKMTKGNDKSVAKSIGKSEAYVRQKIGILKYPEEVREALQMGRIVFSVARELVRIKNDGLRKEYLKHAVTGGATPALVKTWVDDITQAEKRDKIKAGEAEKVSSNLQVQKPYYICSVHEGPTDIENSQLYRICRDCIKELKIGG
jgi:ParB family chromosome partitioning protein